MIKKIYIKTKNHNYNIVIENNSIVRHINKIISNNKKIIFLIDKNVFYKFQKIKNYKKLNYISINCSEKIKSFKFFENVSEKILKIGIDRSSTLVAIGGGSLGDLSGFIASTILRGIKLILVPTTLLSQVDSSVGGKNGINTKNGKNLIGTFYQPQSVFIDPSFLSTLSKRELRSGYAEIVKHSIISDNNFFNWLDKNSNDLLELNEKIVSKAIYKSILIKSKYILSDEKERLLNEKSRAILNFGHTFGHALETFNKYEKKFTHGEAISIGMVIAATLSNRLNYLSIKDLNKIKEHFQSNNLPISSKDMYSNKIFEIIKKDKKIIGGKINFILIKKIGKAFISNNHSIAKIKKIII